MTLIDDSLEGVKTSLLVAIKRELTETYPKEFGDYKTGRGDIYTKVYWDDTARYQPDFPYCTLTPLKDSSDYDEISYFHNNQNVLKKKYNTRSNMNVSINIYDMGSEQKGKSSLQSDTFAHKVARQLRKYFNGDGKLDWFSGNEYFPRQIGIVVISDISAVLAWSDTDTMFKYTFDISIGWEDAQISEAELANGVKITTIENDEKIDEHIFEFHNKGDI